MCAQCPDVTMGNTVDIKKQAGAELEQKKKDFSDQKNKLGLSLRRKKEDFLGKKLTNLKKKWTFWTKKTS